MWPMSRSVTVTLRLSTPQTAPSNISSRASTVGVGGAPTGARAERSELASSPGASREAGGDVAPLVKMSNRSVALCIFKSR